MTLTTTLEFAALLALAGAMTTLWRQQVSTQNDVDALTAQVDKVYAEVVAARDELNARIAELEAAGVDVSGLQAAVQRLDDLTPDAEPVDPGETDGV